jgi:hypothetical protein
MLIQHPSLLLESMTKQMEIGIYSTLPTDIAKTIALI